MSRIIDKLTAMLEAEGYEVHALRPATGFWRSSPHADCYRWEAQVTKGHQFSMGSWDTMTECAKMGIVVLKDHFGGREVWAKSSTEKTQSDP